MDYDEPEVEGNSGENKGLDQVEGEGGGSLLGRRVEKTCVCVEIEGQCGEGDNANSADTPDHHCKPGLQKSY